MVFWKMILKNWSETDGLSLALKSAHSSFQGIDLRGKAELLKFFNHCNRKEA